MSISIFSELIDQDPLFVGMGNILRSDDGAGVALCRLIAEKTPMKTLVVELGIENYLGKIREDPCSSVILLDVVNLGTEPGTYRLLSMDELSGFATHTHNLPLPFIAKEINKPCQVLGIQPQKLEFGSEMSAPVWAAITRIVEELSGLQKRSSKN